MKLSDLGEDKVVALLARNLPLRSEVLVAAGDDCAVIGRPRDRQWQLLKTDAVIEGVHFTSGEDLKRVGWKALCRAISDIAAMGGEPQHALVTLAAPPDTEFARIQALYSGLKRAARRFGIAIVGGETARSPGAIFISIALIGAVERKHCVLRSGGCAGDALFVTGRLGGSLAVRHLDFTPRVEEAQWLVRNARPTAMMDLSDGLGADLPRLAAASGCAFWIDEEKIPRSQGCTIEQALGDGEDYELLFAISPRSVSRLEAAWRKQFRRVPLTCVGELAPAREKLKTATRGFDHFA